MGTLNVTMIKWECFPPYCCVGPIIGIHVVRPDLISGTVGEVDGYLKLASVDHVGRECFDLMGA